MPKTVQPTESVAVVNDMQTLSYGQLRQQQKELIGKRHKLSLLISSDPTPFLVPRVIVLAVILTVALLAIFNVVTFGVGLVVSLAICGGLAASMGTIIASTRNTELKKLTMELDQVESELAARQATKTKPLQMEISLGKSGTFFELQTEEVLFDADLPGNKQLGLDSYP